MPTYEFTRPSDGVAIEVTGPGPPDEATLDRLFAELESAPVSEQGPAPGPPPVAMYPTMEAAVAADVAREAEEAPSTLLGAATAGGSQVVRGIAEAPFVAAEAVGLPVPEAEKFFQAWREQEAKTFRPSVTLEEAEGLEYGTWIMESIARMGPGMAAAMASMPAYAISLVADTARERARADGRDEVSVTDVAAAAAASGFIAASERLGAKVALGGALPKVAQPLAKTVPGRIAAAAGTEAATEVAQEAVQYGAERLGTEQGMAWEELKPRLKEAAVLAPIVGGVLRGGREARLALAQRAGVLPEAIYDDMIDKEVVAQEAEAVIEERDPSVPGEYTQVASPLEAEAVDIQMEAKSAADAVDSLQKSIKAAEEASKPPPRPMGPGPKPVKPRAEFKPPDALKEAHRLLEMYADPETVEGDLLAAVMHVIGRKRRRDAKLSDDEFAAEHSNLDPYIKQIAGRMGMTQGDVDAMNGYERISYADTIKSVEQAGLAPSITPDGVQIPAGLDAIIKKATATSYAPTTTEEAAMHWALMLQRKHRANILESADPKDPASKVNLDALDQKAIEVAVALRRSGTELGRAMRYRQFIVSPVMDLIQAQAEASIRYGGELDPKIKERLKKLWDRAEDIEATGKRLKKEAQGRLGSALAKLEVAEGRLRKAERIAEDAGVVLSKARKEARKKRKDKPTEKAVEEAIEELEASGPIPVKPLRKSPEQKAMEKALKEFEQAQDDVDTSRGEAVAADAEIRRGKRDKATAAKNATTNSIIRGWDRVFGAGIVLKASGDFSAFGRQALPLVVANPLLAINSIPTIVRVASWKPKARAHAKAVQQGILSDPYQTLRDLGGVEITEVEDLTNIHGSSITQGEEAYMFRAMETGLFSPLVVPSKNVFGLTLNILRAKNFDAVVRQMAERNGIKLSGLSPEEQTLAIRNGLAPEDLKAAGMLINVITGRATAGMGTGVAADVMRRTMFAPRFTLSRLEAPIRIAQLYGIPTKGEGLGPFKHMSKASREVLVERVNTNMKVYGALALLTLLAAGDKDDNWEEALSDFFNPNSPSFLRARFGDFHLDMLPGVPATMRYLIPMAFLPDFALPESYQESPSDYARGLWQLANNKAAPLLSAIRTMNGYDWGGREIEGIPEGPMGALMLVAMASKDLAVPISLENVWEAAYASLASDEKTVVQNAAPAMAEFLGVGLAHYDPESKKKGKKGRSAVRKLTGMRQRRIDRSY